MLGTHSHILSIPYGSDLFLPYKKERPTLIKLWNCQVARENKKNRWVEKTPKHVHYIDNIYDVFPKSKIIIITRDGRNVACILKERKGSFVLGMKRWIRENVVWFSIGIK